MLGRKMLNMYACMPSKEQHYGVGIHYMNLVSLMKKQAVSLGLTGWVKNRPDGSVRIVAEGPRSDLETFCAWTARGPDHCRVDRQDLAWSEASGKFDAFLITG